MDAQTTTTDLRDLIATLSVVAATYDGPEPERIDLTSWRAGARAAYADVAQRFQEMAGAE